MLSEYLKRRRRDAGQTQLEAAREVGVSGQTWSNWERDRTRPNREALGRLARWAGVSVDDLYKRIVATT